MLVNRIKRDKKPSQKGQPEIKTSDNMTLIKLILFNFAWERELVTIKARSIGALWQAGRMAVATFEEKGWIENAKKKLAQQREESISWDDK